MSLPDKEKDVISGEGEKCRSRIAKGDRLRVQGVGSYLAQLHPDSLKGNAPPCYPALVNIIHRVIAYPIWICCPDGKHRLK